MTLSRALQKVLILSNDPVAAALIGALVERARLEPDGMAFALHMSGEPQVLPQPD